MKIDSAKPFLVLALFAVALVFSLSRSGSRAGEEAPAPGPDPVLVELQRINALLPDLQKKIDDIADNAAGAGLTYEYKLMARLGDRGGLSSDEAFLNQLGGQGWDLVSVGNSIYIFKRAIPRKRRG